MQHEEDLTGVDSVSPKRRKKRVVEAPRKLPDVVAQVRKELLGAISACFASAKRRDPGLRGKVITRWTVGPDGNVMNFQVAEDSLRSPFVSRCIATMISRYRFEPMAQAMEVNVPFVFA